MATKKLEGPAAKKAAGKSAKKVAHKVAKKAAKKTANPGNDARRAYEHLGRLRSLASSMDTEAQEQTRVLSRYAQAAFHGKEKGSAADLLRAAEHLAFARLALEKGATELSKELRDALKEEFSHRLERAARRWEEQEAKPPKDLRTLYKGLRSDAKVAWKDGRYTGAMEFARAVDALAHAAMGRLRLTSGIEVEKAVALLPEL